MNRLRRDLLLVLATLPARALAGPFDRSPATPELLPVDEALRLQPVLWRAGELWLGWELAPGCYLYRDKLQIEVIEPAGLVLPPAVLPPGERLQDPHFGEVEVWRGSVLLRRPAPQAPQRLRLRYQGCAEDRVCYPPVTREVTVSATLS